MLVQTFSNSAQVPLPRLNWSEFLKRAEAQQIAGITRQWPLACSVTKGLYWRGRGVLLHERPLMFSLLLQMVIRGQAGMTKDEVLKVLYPTLDPRFKTVRYINSKKHNSVKLMSRARNILQDAWNPFGAARFHWLWLDRNRHVWVFMQPKETCI